MQKTEEEKQEPKEGYCCPNPSCNRVFLRPRIIKYLVCPSCQTLVKMDTAEGNAKKKKKGPTEEDIKRKEAELLEAQQKAELRETELLKAEKKLQQIEAERKVERLETERKAKQR